MSLRIEVITLFPGMFPGPLGESIPGRALEQGIATLTIHDLRQWGLGRHHSVDDYPYGGGAGMVLRPEPVVTALDAVAPRDAGATRILLDPGGQRLGHDLAQDLARRDALVLVCPRYEGIDERVREHVDLEVSIGDYVVSGGELPAMVLIDTIIRLLPGAIDDASPVEESFAEGLLEYPQYTRPAEFRGRRVPDILVSGHHAEVARWRHEQALERTRRQRPDLLERDTGGSGQRGRPRPPVGEAGSPGAGTPPDVPS